MRLKRAVLHGFKSFANRTTLHFHPGVTCIVGPNGCGKSNIGDAFRWVIGEQSAKSLRGNKMQDVIFAGTEFTSPLPYAEVSLVLDNSSRWLAVEQDEVSVTRRLHQDGESSYFLNDEPVRLKQLHALFSGTGIGHKDSFAFFEQGKVDQIINLTPYERRFILQGAAGVTPFLIRRKEALTKLDQVKLNLAPVELQSIELEKRLTQLNQEADEARLFKKKQQKKKEVEQLLQRARWNRVRQEKVKGEEELAKTIDRCKLQQEELDLLLNGVRQSQSALAQREVDWRKMSEDYYRKSSQRELALRDSEHIEEQIKSRAKILKGAEEEVAVLKKNQETLKEKKALLEADKEKYALLLKEQAKAVERQREELDHLINELEKKRGAMRVTSEQRYELEKKIAVLEGERKGRHALIERAVKGFEEHRQKRMSLDKRCLELQGEKEQIKRELLELDAEIETHKDALEACLEQMQQQRQQKGLLERELELCRRQLSEFSAQKKALIAMRDSMDGMSCGSKKLLQQSQQSSSPFYGTLTPLYRRLSALAGFETSIATTLQRYGNLLVVDSLGSYNKVLTYAKENKIGDFALICEELLMAFDTPQRDESDRLAKGAVEAESVLADHFLGAIKVEKKRLEDHLKRILEGPCWLEEGFYLDEKGVLFGSVSGETNVFVREAEITHLQQSCERLDETIDRLLTTLASIENHLKLLEAEQQQRTTLLRSKEMKHIEVNFSLQRLHKELERSNEELDLVDGQQKKLRQEQEEHEKAVAELAGALDALQDSSWLLVKSDEEQKELLAELERTLKEKRVSVERQEQSWQQSRDKERQLFHEQALLQQRFETQKVEQERILQQIDRLKGEVAALHSRSEGVDHTLVCSEAELAKVKKSCDEKLASIEASKKQLSGLEKEVEEKKQKLDKGRFVAERKEEEIKLLQDKMEMLAAQYEELYKIAVNAPTPLDHSETIKSLEELETLLKELNRELAEGKSVNYKAIEECDKVAKELEEVKESFRELSESREELIALCEELAATSRQRIKKTFVQIRENFRAKFVLLFEGGEADLKLTESEDVLEAGFEIMARPPGKQMRSISLLSGGEKCLTALALLFAIFEIKPAPYCILDEVDAPLDDSNIARFLKVVKTFEGTCQFIIITHNKRTMASGDRLYGVTMQKRGISTLLSIDFAEAQSEEEVLEPV